MLLWSETVSQENQKTSADGRKVIWSTLKMKKMPTKHIMAILRQWGLVRNSWNQRGASFFPHSHWPQMLMRSTLPPNSYVIKKNLESMWHFFNISKWNWGALFSQILPLSLPLSLHIYIYTRTVKQVHLKLDVEKRGSSSALPFHYSTLLHTLN